jgi:hypothetical protein
MYRWLFSIVAKNVRAWRLFWTNQRNNHGPAPQGYRIPSSARDQRRRFGGYFSELLIEVNLVFSLAPMPFTMLMMASEMPAAIKPYSIAVAPFSSRKNFRSNRMKSPHLCPSIFWLENAGFSRGPLSFRGTELIDA